MILKEKEAKEKLLKGINENADVVKKTLGAKGKNVMLIDSMRLSNRITKDGVSISRKISLPDAVENAGSEIVKNAAEKTLSEAGDGPQPLYSKVLKPTGWTTMGQLKVGDEICGTNGSTQTVTEIYPKGQKEICKVIFSNGQEVECCEDHLWNVTIDNNKEKTIPLFEIIQKGLKRNKINNYSQATSYVKTTQVDFKETEKLKMDPLLVGLLIGDGSLCEKSSIELSLAIGQEKILEEVNLPEGIEYNTKIDNIKNYSRVKFRRIENNGSTMHDFVEKLGLLNKTSIDKYIPKEYLYSSLDNRLRLLQGLTLTDGHINKRGLLEYSTISQTLAMDVLELLRGLGKQVNFRKKIRKQGASYSQKPIYVITELKGYKNGLKIKDIIKTGEYTEMMCIKVSNPDHLYITNDYVVTHNTTTTTILTQSMCNSMVKEINLGKDSNALCADLKKDLNDVREFIKSKSKKIENTEQIRQLAMVSSNSDNEIADILKEIYDNIGFEGSIDVRESDSLETNYEVVKGFTLPNTGYSTHLFVNNTAKNRVELFNSKVLIFNGKINNVSNELINILDMNLSSNDDVTPLVLIVHDIEDYILGNVMASLSDGMVRDVVVVKSNLIHNNRANRFKDACAFLDAEYSETSYGKLGFCERIIIEKDNTVFINGRGDVKKYVQNLKKELVKNKDLETKDRIFRIESKAAVINVGGKLQDEIGEKKDRIDDAVLAVKSAIEEGFCAGGSSTYIFANKELELRTEVMKNALISCYAQLMTNANKEPYFIMKTITDKEYGYAYNVSTSEVENFLEKGIIDSTKVLRVSLENSVHTACTFAMIEAIVE